MSDSETIIVLIPAPLRRYTGGESKVSSSGSNVTEVLASLESSFPGLRDRIVEENGEIRRFVNVFVNGQNVRKLDGIATITSDGDEIGIVPAMAGGTAA
ncbi:MoaD/ThiS family protein [soil metagenome]